MEKHRQGESEENRMFVGVAFDSLRIRIKEFAQLEQLYGPLNTLWGRVVEEEEAAIASGEVVVPAEEQNSM
ncbi:hypothetical protein HDU98_009588 [Podochytrium sp. JEL0797]|nr:hypothetical protein HDU98_009588 [Podochytrium sp. JEL0797]